MRGALLLGTDWCHGLYWWHGHDSPYLDSQLGTQLYGGLHGRTGHIGRVGHCALLLQRDGA